MKLTINSKDIQLTNKILELKQEIFDSESKIELKPEKSEFRDPTVIITIITSSLALIGTITQAILNYKKDKIKIVSKDWSIEVPTSTSPEKIQEYIKLAKGDEIKILLP